MKIWKVILATLVIFATGVITGGLLVGIADGVRERRHHWFQTHAAKTHPTAPASVTNEPPARLTLPIGVPARRQFPKDFLERLDRELKLTPEQHRQIDQVLDEGQKRTKEIWDRIAPEVREEMKKSRAQILDLLTPEQKSRFEELMKPRAPKPPREVPPAATNPPAPTEPIAK